eukprot:scaffold271613_cov33-Prasinocladus_malaysianus.AAC.1
MVIVQSSPPPSPSLAVVPASPPPPPTLQASSSPPPPPPVGQASSPPPLPVVLSPPSSPPPLQASPPPPPTTQQAPDTPLASPPPPVTNELAVELRIGFDNLTSEDITEDDKTAMTKVIADAAGINRSEVEIVEIKDISPARKRRQVLQQSIGSGIEVLFQLSGFASEQQANATVQKVVSAAELPADDPQSMSRLLQDEGVAGVSVAYVTPPSVIVLNKIDTNVNVSVLSPPSESQDRNTILIAASVGGAGLVIAGAIILSVCMLRRSRSKASYDRAGFEPPQSQPAWMSN